MRAFKPSREKINNEVVELPNAIVLCARHGFVRVAVDIDPQRGVLGVVRDGAPSDGQAATLRYAELVLDCGPELACREAKCLVWSSLEQLVSAFAVGRGEEGHASEVVSSELFGAACDRGALEAPDVIEGKYVEFVGPVSEGVGISV